MDALEISLRGLGLLAGQKVLTTPLSAFATNESKQRAMECGFDLYSSKPFEPELITRDVLDLMRTKGGRGVPEEN